MPVARLLPHHRALEIVEVDDEATVREAEALIDQVIQAGGEVGELLTPECLDDRFRVCVGRVDGRAVTAATTNVGDGFVGLFAVATTGMRGHAYGEAATWAATLCGPKLPATLQASAMGRPIYGGWASGPPRRSRPGTSSVAPEVGRRGEPTPRGRCTCNR